MDIKLSEQELETIIDALIIAGVEYSRHSVAAFNYGNKMCYSAYEQKKTEAFMLCNKLRKEKEKHSCDIGSLTADKVEPRKK